MRFPKAQAGVSKLFTAEILMIVMVVCTLIGIFLPIPFAFFAGILAIIAFILMMVGLGQAQKDDAFFKVAFICALAGIVLSAIGTLLTISSPTASTILSFLANLSQVFVQIFAIKGIMSVATQLGDYDLAERGKRLIWIIACTYGIGVILNLVGGLVRSSYTLSVIAIIFTIAAVILEFISLILYISLLSKAKQAFLQ